MKHKRYVTDEQREVLRANLAKARQVRMSKRVGAAELSSPAVATVEKLRAPEVQAVLDTMDPERRAKLASIQARNLANLAQTREGREAIERMEERHNPTAVLPDPTEKVVLEKPVELPPPTLGPIKPVEPPRVAQILEVPYKVPFRLTGSLSGQMVSELGPCICGEAKLKWHAICLKVKVHG